MKKTVLLLITLSVLGFQSFSQNNASDSTEHFPAPEQKALATHRFYLNPTQILTGQYTLACGFRINMREWIEGALGYQYIPQVIVDKLPIAPSTVLIGIIYAEPEYGAGFNGPIASFSFSHSYTRKPDNNWSLKLIYKHVDHRADCYFSGGSEDYPSFTFSSTKNVVAGEMLFTKLLKSTHTIIWQWYGGVGVHVGQGTIIRYADSSYYMYKPYSLSSYCVQDIHAPGVLPFPEHLSYVLPLVQAGFRLGFQ